MVYNVLRDWEKEKNILMNKKSLKKKKKLQDGDKDGFPDREKITLKN